jgi:hypothetical protein
MTFTKGWKKYLNLTVDFDFVASVVIAVPPPQKKKKNDGRVVCMFCVNV